MYYKFENKAVFKVLEKLVIIVTNLLVCYLIVEISYVEPLLITKLIVLGVESKVFREASFASNGIVELTEKTRPN